MLSTWGTVLSLWMHIWLSPQRTQEIGEPGTQWVDAIGCPRHCYMFVQGVDGAVKNERSLPSVKEGVCKMFKARGSWDVGLQGDTGRRRQKISSFLFSFLRTLTEPKSPKIFSLPFSTLFCLKIIAFPKLDVSLSCSVASGKGEKKNQDCEQNRLCLILLLPNMSMILFPLHPAKDSQCLVGFCVFP